MAAWQEPASEEEPITLQKTIAISLAERGLVSGALHTSVVDGASAPSIHASLDGVQTSNRFKQIMANNSAARRISGQTVVSDCSDESPDHVAVVHDLVDMTL